jgi:type IV pilus assembly protein PilM
MNLISGVSEYFGLDISPGALRLVQLAKSTSRGGLKPLVKYAQMPIDAKLVLSDAKADQQKVAVAIKQLLENSKMTTKNVAAGLLSHKVFTTVVDMDRLSPAELAKTISYQVEPLIPTPLSESKVDWALLGDSPKDKTKVEVLITSVANEYVEMRLDLLESVGLNVIAFEPNSIALVRALVPVDTVSPMLILDIGNRATDLVITMEGTPRLIRSIPTGSEAIIKTASQNLNISEEQAQQFVFKFGLSKDKLEGQVRGAVLSSIDLLTAEIDKSIKFFESRYSGKKIERIIVSGGASSLPEFPLHLATKFNVNVEIGNAWRNVAFPPERQNELLALSNSFSVAAGLAERNE